MVISNAPPEQGQLVKVRGRAWIVSDIRRSALEPNPLASLSDSPQHLITLSSVEDDGMGEEIRVIWEIEPGATPIEGGGLPEPTGFDDPAKLDAFLHAVQWGASSTADYRVLLSPYRSGIQIEDYQLDPVVRAVQMPRANLLIADDVGLGKTIEAGLVIQEFITRHRARTVLIVCPSSLQIQWHDQMRDKFGLEFRIIDSALFQELRRRRGIHVNPWTHFPRLITSIDFIKRERPLDLMRAVLPPDGRPTYPRRFDFLIVDEAHNTAPSGRGNYATDSMRTLAIRTIAPHFEHRLFVTATPHNGYPESFTALLEILDNQRFARGVQPDERQLRAVMVRRLKSELESSWDGQSRFPRRVLSAIKVPYNEEERSVHAALNEYTKLRKKAASDRAEEFAAEFVMKLLKKRLFSSPQAFALTLRKHLESFVPVRTQRASRPTFSLLRKQTEALEEEFADDTAQNEVMQEVINAATMAQPGPTAQEEALIQQMLKWAEGHRGRPDSKAEELLNWLKKEIRSQNNWTNNRVIIFTEYKDTQNWLMDILAAEGFTRDGRLMTLYGGMEPERREQIKAAFQASTEESAVRILLATDAASEGIDLQAHCSRLIHYEIPWNPNRLEQRNGRIDRYGQKASEVQIFHFVDQRFKEDAPAYSTKPGDLAGDLEFLYRAVLKLQEMERDLFGKVAPVVAQQVEEAMLGVRQTLDTSIAEKEAEPVRRALKFERDLRKQIERLAEKLKETRLELDLSAENIYHVVSSALELAGQPALIETELKGAWPELKQHYKSCPVFYLPAFRGSWAACSEGLAHPHSGKIRPITFDHAIARDRDDVVLVHLNHRLVQMSLRLLRAEVWSDSVKKGLNRVTARVIPDSIVETPALIGYARLVLVGKDGQRLHEEILTAGGSLTEGRFRRLNVGEVQKVHSSATAEKVSSSLQQRFAKIWPQLQNALLQALEARTKERSEGLQKALRERAEKETNDIRTILTELRRSILNELESEGPEQRELFTSEEREQLERNRTSLHWRADQIPDEIEKEIKSILGRFADPQAHLFPVAISYFVPRSIAVKEGR